MLRAGSQNFPRCTCNLVARPFALQRPQSRSYAAPPPPPFEEQIVQAARKVLEDGDKMDEGSIEAAKRSKQMETLRTALRDVEEAEETLLELLQLSASESDPDLRDLAEADIPDAETRLRETRRILVSVIAPPPAANSLSALVELKAGVGGSESALFAAELVKMYQRLATRRGWKASVVEYTSLEGAGFGSAYKEALVEVSGDGAFGYLRREAGVHRVQRVPTTESQGRVHTSTVACIVLPSESGNQHIEDDLFEMKDVKVETMRSRGAGGQHVNKTESAIRLTHLPTGVTVSMQDSRSQHENRTKAFQVLRARLLDRKIQADQEARRSMRRTQFRGADRSEKIRTYNFPQGRLTDHRIPLTLSALEDAMEGGETLDIINGELEEMENREKMEDILAGIEES
ncbi:Peptide chain release factor 1 [Rhodotorula toruloides ATCC 204091]|uniref:BY PROTMAP: gi/342319251/gb/EGU11201.1/ Peptide chain release factor 1 [Rhodotorula glutinis ATCC 204091] n=1 Tax=Rhodotorula toruloides TaxID=5286 RepID=A0A0K3CQB5_RHOTO|nr:Peptide chain release factor 1 [Rhodotorula toruloides ATCC 204091]